jgi:hypothetical protein
MMMLDVVGLVRVAQSHPDSLDFRSAEILEHKRLNCRVRFDSLVKIAAPPIGTQLARPDYENIATNHFNPFHKSHLLGLGMAAGAGYQDKLFSTIVSVWLMPDEAKSKAIGGFSGRSDPRS